MGHPERINSSSCAPSARRYAQHAHAQPALSEFPANPFIGGQQAIIPHDPFCRVLHAVHATANTRGSTNARRTVSLACCKRRTIHSGSVCMPSTVPPLVIVCLIFNKLH